MVSATPLTRVVEIVDVPVDPCWIETLVGFALMEKSFGGGGAVTVNERLVGLALIEKSSDGGAAVTVKLTEVLCVALAAVPVIVMVYVPGAAVPAPTVRVELPPAVTEVGLSVAVAPAGAPLTVRLTVSAGPLVTAVG